MCTAHWALWMVFSVTSSYPQIISRPQKLKQKKTFGRQRVVFSFFLEQEEQIYPFLTGRLKVRKRRTGAHTHQSIHPIVQNHPGPFTQTCSTNVPRHDHHPISTSITTGHDSLGGICTRTVHSSIRCSTIFSDMQPVNTRASIKGPADGPFPELGH
jgi:hypothetical protein